MWTFLILPVVAALITTLLLFLLRKRAVAPWIWVPVTAWSAWGGLSLLPTAMPRDPIYGPAQWNLFGLDALFVLCALVFTGVVVVGALISFPRRLTWRVKSWLGGFMVAVAVPLAGWFIFTNPYSLRLIGPDGKPVAGATIYRFHRGLGGRLPAVTGKISDAEGIVTYRGFRLTELTLVTPGNSSWVTTELSIRPPREGYVDLNPFDFTKLINLSWGNGLSTPVNQAFRSKPAPAWTFPDRETRGRAGWMIRDGEANAPIPVFLHSRVKPIHTGLLELLRAQLKDTGLAARFPSFVQEIVYGGYGILLGQELRELHIQAANTNVLLELHLREALFTQAGMLADWRNIDRAQQARGAARKAAIDDIRPLIGKERGSPMSLNLEPELPVVRARVHEAARLLLEHIRLHPGTTGRSVEDFESLLAEPELDLGTQLRA